MFTAVEQASHLEANLTKQLAERAKLDEQIAATRNMLQGVALGIELQKETQKESDDDAS